MDTGAVTVNLYIRKKLAVEIKASIQRPKEAAQSRSSRYGKASKF